MQITTNKVVMIHYVLTDEQGEVLDKSDDQPMAYIHGTGNLIVGLEKALEGKQVGDNLEVRVEAKEAYGERNEDAVQVVPRAAFEGVEKIGMGMQFQAQSPDGHLQLITVIDVDGDDITIDGNHPLAGKPLNFSVEIVGIRDADPEELEHGHVHGPGGHEH
ncbi:MAG: FKBP-type peptidyl-prolyl cis-trans isomerase [bacterium]